MVRMKHTLQRAWRSIDVRLNQWLTLSAIALTTAVAFGLVNWTRDTGESWPAFLAGIVVFVVLAALLAMLNPRWRK